MDESTHNNLQKDSENQKKAIVSAGEKKPIHEPEVEVISDKIHQQADKKLLLAQRSEFFSGPIPPPELLARYNKIIPNGADRILTMAEQQQSHRHYLEKSVVECDMRRSDRGLLLGFVITAIFGIGGIYLIATGHNLNGLAIIFMPLATLVGTFIYAQNSRKKERIEKSKSIKEQEQQEKVHSEDNNGPTSG